MILSFIEDTIKYLKALTYRTNIQFKCTEIYHIPNENAYKFYIEFEEFNKTLLWLDIIRSTRLQKVQICAINDLDFLYTCLDYLLSNHLTGYAIVECLAPHIVTKQIEDFITKRGYRKISTCKRYNDDLLIFMKLPEDCDWEKK